MSTNRRIPARIGGAGAAAAPGGWPLAHGFYYSSTPMIAVDAYGRIVEVNAALRVLLGADVAGCKGSQYEFLSGRLRPRLEGDIFPADGITRGLAQALPPVPIRPMYSDVGIAETRCRYRSPAFGVADLRVFEIPRIGTATGELEGSVLDLEILDLEREAAYRSQMRRRWAHEVMWEIYATSYDAIIPRMPFYQEVLDRHLAAMRADGIDRVLDIGAGTGTVTVPLVREGKAVTAVDVGRAMLARLSSKLDRTSAIRSCIIEDTAECLPRLADGSFDGVTALNSFFDMGDPHAGLREAMRVLRPGGTIIITDPKECFNARALIEFAERFLHERGLFDELRDDWIRVQSVTPALEAGIAANRGGGPADAAAMSGPPWHAEAIYDILRDSGFVDLSFEDAHLGHCATIRGKKS